MKLNIYESSGYLNIPGILSLGQPFTFVVGGRGTGKTYGALKYAITSGRKFMLMRRTQSQTDLINKPEFSPFKPICTDLGMDIETQSLSKYNSMFLKDERILGYTCALSTISNMRGFDASDIDLLIYDEFIPERHERLMKGEGGAFLNAYETMNRNRELQGKKPLQALLLANAFDIANPIFLELGLIGIAEKMKQKHQELYVNPDKGLCIVMPQNSRISDRKANTALYRLAGDTFSSMALSNDFVYNPTDNIKSQPIREYAPLVGIGDICIYRHKNNSRYYVSEHTTGNPEHFDTDEVNIKRFLKKYGIRLYKMHMKGKIIFEDMTCKAIFEDIIM